jgi:hypothetical protein
MIHTGLRNRFVPSRWVCGYALMAAILLSPNGCDRSKGDGGTATSATPANTSPPPTDSERYASSIAKLMEELTRMRLLVADPGSVTDEEFAHQYREVQLRFTQVDPTLSADDRQRSSWQHITQANRFLEAATQDRKAINAILARSADTPPPEKQLQEDESQFKRGIDQAAADLSALPKLEDDTPRAMAAAGGAILLAEDDLRKGQ